LSVSASVVGAVSSTGDDYAEGKSVIAKNRIHHSTNYPSKIRLPFVYN